MIPGTHSNKRSASGESIEGQAPVSMEPRVQNVMHPGSGSQPPLQEALSKVLNMQLTKLFIYGPFTLCPILFHFCLQFDANALNGFYTDSLHLTQHPIDAMLQFDANANAHTNAKA